MLAHVVAAVLGSCEIEQSFSLTAGSHRMLDTIATGGPGDGGAARRRLSTCEDSDVFSYAFFPGTFVIYGIPAGSETCPKVMELAMAANDHTWQMVCAYTLATFDAGMAEGNVPMNTTLVELYPDYTFIYEACPETCNEGPQLLPEAGVEVPCDGNNDASPSLADLGFTEVVGDGVTNVSGTCACWSPTDLPDLPIDKDVVSTEGKGGCCKVYSNFLYSPEAYEAKYPGSPNPFGYEQGKYSKTTQGPGAVPSHDYTRHNGVGYSFTGLFVYNSAGFTDSVQSKEECAELCLSTNGCSGFEIRANWTEGYCLLWYNGACDDVSDPWFHHWGTSGGLPDVCQTYRLDSPVVIVGDPITEYQGRETRYWLSMEHFTSVLEQGPIGLSQLAGPAHPPPGLEAHKGDWVVAMEVDMGGLDKIRIEVADPTTLLERPNATAPLTTALTTLRLSAGGSPLALGEHTLSALGATLSARRLPEQKIGRGFAEQVDIQAQGLHLRITSAKANKLADEALQVLGLHLDLEIVAFDATVVRGALPEMWGLQPMSEATKKLLAKPAAA